MTDKRLGIVTGASSGIGRELARICADEGLDMVIAADDPDIHRVADDLRGTGVTVEALEADLATSEGVDRLVDATRGRPVDVLIANAGEAVGGAFLEVSFDALRHVIGTNVTGTLYLLHRLVPRMVERGQGRVLITGSIAGFVPGSFNAVYNATKGFVDSFAFALREEIRDSGVTVTCLMPGATDTEFFERAGMEDTQLGQAKKEAPDKVARVGWEAMMRGDGDVVSGVGNKIVSAAANVTPAGVLARRHRKMAEPGSGD